MQAFKISFKLFIQLLLLVFWQLIHADSWTLSQSLLFVSHSSEGFITDDDRKNSGEYEGSDIYKESYSYAKNFISFTFTKITKDSHYYAFTMLR